MRPHIAFFSALQTYPGLLLTRPGHRNNKFAVFLGYEVFAGAG